MRTPLLSLVLATVTSAPVALATPPASAADDIGTTPARSPAQLVAADEERVSHRGLERGPEASPHPAMPAPIATEPPGDWWVLHAGVRPRLGTFGGIAALGLAHERIERFYGVLSLSLIRNDAGTHYGGVQLALGRNLSDDFGGIAQIGVGENRARSFAGVGQLALAYNRTLDTAAVFQVAGYNRAGDFAGALQQIGRAHV